jgi:hypothetical protein
MQASSGQSRRLGLKASSASDVVSISRGNPGRVPTPFGPPPASPPRSLRSASRDGPPRAALAKPAGSPRDSGSGVGKAGGLAAGFSPVPPGASVPQTVHFPSLPMRPIQEPSGQSLRRLGSNAVLSLDFVDMMREWLIEPASTPRHIVAPLRCPQFPTLLANSVPTEVATSPKP